jgi:hypothetical protein
MYLFVLAIHSLLRWVVLATGVIAVVRAVGGLRGRRAWTPADARAGLWFALALDVQFLVGLLLYFALSPITRVAFGDFGAAMGNTVLRFWTVEHVFGMLIGLALVHIGRVRARKTADPVQRHKLSALFYGLALVAIAVTIPWPGMPAGRPLVRGF